MTKHELLKKAIYFGDIENAEKLYNEGVFLSEDEKKEILLYATNGVFIDNSKSKVETEKDKKNIVNFLLKIGVNLNYKKVITEQYGVFIDNSKSKVETEKDKKVITEQYSIFPTVKEFAPLVNAVQCNYFTIVQLLIHNRTQVNIKVDNTTPLCQAVENNNIEMIQYLLKNGADINFSDKNGNTPLMIAIKKEAYDIAEFLQKNNADATLKNKDNKTALMMFKIDFDNINKPIENTVSNIKKFILNDVNVQKESITLQNLFIKSLFYHDNFEFSNFLLKYGANINKENELGYMALPFIIENVDDNHTIILEYLIEKNADINTYFAKENITPLTFAMICKKENSYKILSKNGAESNPTLIYLLKNAQKFEKDYFEKKFKDLVQGNEIKQPLSLLKSWSYFDKPIDRDKIDICILIIDKLNIKLKNYLTINHLTYMIDPNNVLQELERLLEKNLYTSKTFEDVLKQFIKFPNTPKELVKILTNFRKDTPIKYTTHSWDMDFQEEYKDFSGFMKEVKRQWEKIEQELKKLSTNLHRKIYDFLINEQEAQKSWCSKEGDALRIGWSSLEGLDTWCNEGGDPFEYKLPQEFTVEGKTLTHFKHIIELFKQEIQIRREGNVLEKIFAEKEEWLDDTCEEAEFEVTTIKLKEKQFYTDTENFRKIIDKIFQEIIKHPEYPNIEVKIEESKDDTCDDAYYDLLIVQIDSYAQLNANTMKNMRDGGDFVAIKEFAENLCNWSIENSYNGKHYRVNYLKYSHGDPIEMLDYKPKGFTHRLRFYQ